MKKILTGMLALMLVAGAAQAQEKQDTKPKKERAERLGLTEEQKTKLKSIHEARKAEMESLKKSDLTPEQQKEKRKEIAKKYHDQIQGVYTPEQKDKMKKMMAERKAKGKKDFHRGGKKNAQIPDLTEDQKAKMKTLREEFQAKAKAIREDKSLTDEQRKEKFRALQKENREKMQNILTKEQQEKMKAGRKEHKVRTKR